MQFDESHDFHVPQGRRREPGGRSETPACRRPMQLGPGCWVCRGLSAPLPMLCPGFFDSQLGHACPKALDTSQAVASQRLSTPLQLSQEPMGCVCCRSSSLLVTNWLPCAIGLAKAHVLLQLLVRPKAQHPSQCCSTRLKMFLSSLMALLLP